MEVIEEKPLEAAKRNCMKVANIQIGSINEMGGQIQEMILHYYQDVRRQAQQSFYAALGAAIVGTCFFIYAAWLHMQSHSDSSRISLIAGALIQVISGINFFLYGKTARQFSHFHICLERTNRFLLANTVCENISCSVKKDITRQEIIKKIINSPMLTLNVINNGEGAIEKETNNQT